MKDIVLTPLKAKILFEVQRKPRLAMIQICRTLNRHFKYHCNRRRCFANPRKRKTMIIFPCECEIKRPTVFKALRQMQSDGLIIIRKEKKADGKNNRGWDFMNVIYSTLHTMIA